MVLLLVILAYVPIGLLCAALMLVFRTTGPLPNLVILLSSLLGGVYYPTHVVPSWLKEVSTFIPLAYGLRALRRVLLDGLPLAAVAGDLGVLVGWTAVLLTVSWYVLGRALQYARSTGTLGQY